MFCSSPESIKESYLRASHRFKILLFDLFCIKFNLRKWSVFWLQTIHDNINQYVSKSHRFFYSNKYFNDITKFKLKIMINRSKA